MDTKTGWIELSQLSDNELEILELELNKEKNEIELNIITREKQLRKVKLIENKNLLDALKEKHLELKILIYDVIIEKKRRMQEFKLLMEYPERLLSSLIIVCEENGCHKFIKEARSRTK